MIGKFGMLTNMSRFAHMLPPTISGCGATRITCEPVDPPTLFPSASDGLKKNGPVRRLVVVVTSRLQAPPLLNAAPPNAMKRSMCGKNMLLSYVCADAGA